MSESVSGQPLRILVVDDSPVVRDGLSRYFTNQEKMVVVGSARNGREAIEQMASQRPDLVLMDVHMPEMDGLEAATRIRGRFPNVRILLISLDQDATTRKDCLAHGADGFIPKIGMQRKLMVEIRNLFRDK